MRKSLLAWQRAIYPEAHRDRVNLAIHLLTVPIFVAGIAAVIAGVIAVDPWIAIGGLAAAVGAIAIQGRGHAREEAPPAPFDGGLDAIARIFAEQLITFPRFVIGGGFARAWRRDAEAAEEEIAEEGRRHGGEEEERGTLTR